MNKTTIIEQYTEAFDHAFLGQSKLSQEEVNELFTKAGIDGFINRIVERKVGGFSHSQKSLQDLTKLSFSVYTNLEQLPLQKNISLPEENGSYKFVVTAKSPFYNLIDSEAQTNEITLVANEKAYHNDILQGIGYNQKGAIIQKINNSDIFGGGWLNIDHDKKTIFVDKDSGGFGSCSNELVERMLEEKRQQGYTIIINLDDQREFFKNI